MNKPNPLSNRLRAVCASPKFFYAVIGLFVLQALWIALSSHYPMAFDEDFHLGIIKLYAHHLSPFWSGQPSGSGMFGAIARDPSYLYQWLMSFPYRLLTVITSNQAAIVIALRLINIALFGLSLPLYRRLLLKTGASRALVHACLFIFVLLPVVPLLAAQINYDNLLLPMVAWVLLLTIRIKGKLQHERLPLHDILLLLGVGMIASLVKYAFLPIFVTALAYLAIITWRVHGPRKTFRSALGASWRAMSAAAKISLLALVVVSGVLFVERYGVNTLKYHTPIPDCGDVLTVQECRAYAPWARDYVLNQKLAGAPVAGPIQYSGDWFYGLWLRTFFAVAGPADNFETRSPLPVPGLAVITLAAAGLIAVLIKGRTIWRRYDKSVLTLFASVSVLYVASLWSTGYKGFRYTGQPVAINGRYLFPILLPLMIIGALGLYELLKSHSRTMAVMTLIIFFAFLWGGGAWTYIIRSSDNWYWHNPAILHANHAVQHVLWPITPGANRSSDFL